jgi:hypothetical protein
MLQLNWKPSPSLENIGRPLRKGEAWEDREREEQIVLLDGIVINSVIVPSGCSASWSITTDISTAPTPIARRFRVLDRVNIGEWIVVYVWPRGYPGDCVAMGG